MTAEVSSTDYRYADVIMLLLPCVIVQEEENGNRPKKEFHTSKTGGLHLPRKLS